MRRLIRNTEGEPRPLIMHRRLYRLRALDQRVRLAVCKAMGWEYRRPRYLAPQRTPEQDAETRLAIEAFVGQRSPDPRLVRYFSERTRLMQLADPMVSDDAKRRLDAEGPRCSPADEAHALSICEPGLHWTAHPEAQAALARIKQEAELTAARLAASSS